MELTGFAFVIGGGSGISRAVCNAFAQCGVRGLLVADIDLEAAIKTATECKAVATDPSFRVETVHIDVSVPDLVEHATKRMAETFGRIDYCVNGAGILGHVSDIATSDLATFKRVLDINVQGTFLVLKSVSTVMASQPPQLVDTSLPARGVTRGAIVNIGSIASHIALPQSGQYVASKHAVLGLTKSAAMDNIKHNVRVNCVCPSWVDTPMIQALVTKDPQLGQKMLSTVPMGRFAVPEEIADVIMFLCSSKSSWVNGSYIMADGAMTLGPYIPDLGLN